MSSWKKKLDAKYTCEELLTALKAMNFVEVKEQGLIPAYRRESIADDLHDVCGLRTDYQFTTKSKMKTIQKKVKEGNTLVAFHRRLGYTDGQKQKDQTGAYIWNFGHVLISIMEK